MSESETEIGRPFADLDEALERGGPAAALDTLVERLEAEKRYRELFEALLMRKRFELGLAIEGTETLRELPESVQETVENFYIETCRKIGGLFLDVGDLPAAWPYFKAIDEPDLVARALEEWTPPEDAEEDDGASWEENSNLTDQVVNVAFYEGAHPCRGYELILSEYGTCRAVTTFEHQFPHPESKPDCAAILVKHLYEELLDNLRGDLERRAEGASAEASSEDEAEASSGDEPKGSPKPGEGLSVREIAESHPELFDEHGYHIDLSHLQATVRAATLLRTEDELDLGIQLCEYGRRLARDFKVQDDPPPFEDFYDDYRIFLQALAGRGVDGAVRYFRNKMDRNEVDENGQYLPAEVLVFLLDAVGRHEEAIEVWRDKLSSLQGPFAIAPPLGDLSRRAGTWAGLLEESEAKEDILGYATALVRSHR